MVSQSAISAPRFVALECGIAYDWDDYGKWCSFFYDLKEGKVIRDDYGHGQGGNVNEREAIPYKEAIAQGLISVETLASAVLEAVYTPYISDEDVMASGEYSVPCAIRKGRKMRGEKLICVGIVRELSYLQPRYGNERNYDKFAIVYDPAQNIKCKTAIKNVVFSINRSECILRAIINNPTKNLWTLIHCLAYGASYSACDSRYLAENIHSLIRQGMTQVERPNLEGVIDPWDTKRVNTKREKHRASVEAWAREKLAGESEDKIQQVVERTLQKYYA